MMVKTGAKRSKIYDFLLERGENVTRKDVSNIIHKVRNISCGLNDNDSCAATLATFAYENEQNVVTVDEREMINTMMRVTNLLKGVQQWIGIV